MSRLEERLEKCERAQQEAMQARRLYQEAQRLLRDEQGNLLEALLTDVGPSQAVESGCISVNLSAVRRMVYPRERR